MAGDRRPPMTLLPIEFSLSALPKYAGRAAVALLTLLTLIESATAEQYTVLNFHYVAKGPTEILGGWTCWFANCKYAPCHMVTEREPQLGTLRPYVSPGPIPAEAGARCRGVSIPKLHLTYTPRPGARGDDEVTLRSTAENGGRHLIYIHIEVP